MTDRLTGWLAGCWLFDDSFIHLFNKLTVNDFRFERQVGLNTLFMGLGQMAGKSQFIQPEFHFSLSFFCLCGNYWKILMNIYCAPALYVSGTMLSARDTKMT